MVHVSLLPVECTGERKNGWCAICRYVRIFIGSLIPMKRHGKPINGFCISPWRICCRNTCESGEWREQVDEHDYNAILLWREFRNIYDEVTQQSSLPLYLVVREALKNLKQEIANGASYGRKDADGNWIVTRTDQENLDRLEELTNLFSLTRFLANKTEQVKVDFKRKFGLLAEQYREVIDKKLESNLVKKAHHDSMVMELQKWAQGWEDLPLNQITSDMIEEKLASSDIENNRSATPLDDVTAQPCMDFLSGRRAGTSLHITRSKGLLPRELNLSRLALSPRAI